MKRKLIVGLGNPGNNFSLTKHNAGYWIVDQLIEARSLKYKLGKGDYIYTEDQNQNVFVKPTTYVNNSGLALKHIMKMNKLRFQIKNGLVIVDEKSQEFFGSSGMKPPKISGRVVLKGGLGQSVGEIILAGHWYWKDKTFPQSYRGKFSEDKIILKGIKGEPDWGERCKIKMMRVQTKG